VAEDPRVQNNPYYGAATETLKFGGPPPAFAGSSNWGLTVVLPAFQRVLLGEIKPEEAVDIMMKGLDKAVKG
jgi:multiple sugar transport system substrate-binding protein